LRLSGDTNAHRLGAKIVGKVAKPPKVPL
jgi:hypothetical protein